MTAVLVVHGVGQEYLGGRSLGVTWRAGLCDGVERAGGGLDEGKVAVAFYGDLFRPRGTRTVGMPDYDAGDVDDPMELALLRAWWEEAARIGRAVPGPADASRMRTPSWVQRALYALSGSGFFAGMGERMLIGSLKQVRAYFTDPAVRERIQDRVREAITPETTVLVGHSLGSVVGYEVLCGTPGSPVSTLVTLGSPLGIPNLVFDRLVPAPAGGRGAWPPPVQRWTNIADRGDIVALNKALAPLFGGGVTDVLVDNGAKAHDVLPYLTARETGTAVQAGLV